MPDGYTFPHKQLDRMVLDENGVFVRVPSREYRGPVVDRAYCVAPIGAAAGRPRSRPKRGVCIHTPDSIYFALRVAVHEDDGTFNDDEIFKGLGLTDRGFPYSSRLAMLMTESGSHEFYMNPETIHGRTNPVDDAEVEAGFRTIVRLWKLFEYDAKARRGRGCWLRVYKKRETSDQFKARVLRIIDAEFSIFWKIADITTGCWSRPSPHSHAEFMMETGRTERTVSRCLASLVEKGYVLKNGREKTSSSSLYLRPTWPGDGGQFYHEKVVDNLESRYVLGRRTDRPDWREDQPEEERPRPIRKRRVIKSLTISSEPPSDPTGGVEIYAGG